MILLLGGTVEARHLATQLVQAGQKVLLSTATLLGLDLAGPFAGRVRYGPLEAADMEDLVRLERVRVLVDATHPFAVEVTNNALKVCQKVGIPYYRLYRPSQELPINSLVIRAGSPLEAATAAGVHGPTTFLTTGTKDLPVYAGWLKMPGRRLVVRVLPLQESLQACWRAGIPAQDIIAVQGPFTKDFNVVCFRHFAANVVITKNSGRNGGTGSKVAACLQLGIPVVVIDQPQESEKSYSSDEIISLLKKQLF